MAKRKGKIYISKWREERKNFKVLKKKSKPSIWSSHKTSKITKTNKEKYVNVTGLCYSDKRGHH